MGPAQAQSHHRPTNPLPITTVQTSLKPSPPYFPFAVSQNLATPHGSMPVDQDQRSARFQTVTNIAGNDRMTICHKHGTQCDLSQDSEQPR